MSDEAEWARLADSATPLTDFPGFCMTSPKQQFPALQKGSGGTMSPDEMEALRRLADGATPGPWTTLGVRADGAFPVLAELERGRVWIAPIGSGRSADAEFIAASRTAVPALLAALAASRAREDEIRAKVEALHPVKRNARWMHVDRETGPEFREGDWCSLCRCPWPCPTVAALAEPLGSTPDPPAAREPESIDDCLDEWERE